METDTYPELRDRVSAKLVAAEVRIAELERENAEFRNSSAWLNRYKSPVDAVTLVLAREAGITPSNLLVMMLIDAVRETTPPPEDVTIGMLTKILQSLDPTSALDSWVYRSSSEIVKILSRRPEVKQIVWLANDESIWCQLEGTIAGMLSRVCRGQDL